VDSNGRSWVGALSAMAFRQPDEKLYARAILHVREPQFFKTTGRRSQEARGAESPAPMALREL
jgi:hypothetical protein